MKRVKMHKTTGSAALLFAASFIFVLSLGAQAAAATPDLGSRDWSVSAKPNLAAKPPPKQAIQAFLTKLFAGDADFPIYEYEPSEYDSFAFADLRQSGTLSLVAALAPGGPGGCGQTVIVDKLGKKFESAAVDCMGSPVEISGKPVVESYEQIPPYYGQGDIRVGCNTIFPVIYGWNGSAYVDMSKQYPGYYRETLQKLQHEIASPPANLVSSYQKRHLSLDSASSQVGCDKIEAAEIERFLGISPDTGLEEDAIRWSQSSNKIDRLGAVQLFSMLGTPRALDHLKAMTGDSDPKVAGAAEGNLDRPIYPGSAEDLLERVGHLKVYTEP
jgi:hypothetical protein